jgi:hypothetical protein
LNRPIKVKGGWFKVPPADGTARVLKNGEWVEPAVADLSDSGTIPTLGHGHPQSDIINLVSDLAGKASTAVFTSVANGLAPASGGGTTSFLRADGTWATPAGGGGGSGTDESLIMEASL